jgi:hypothetical protein
MPVGLRCRSVTYYFLAPAVFLLAAQRAFINCESLLRPAAVIPRLPPAQRPAQRPALFLAQRARAAAESFARVAADILLLVPPALPPLVTRGAELPSSESKRLSKLSICRRRETASSKFLRDKSMGRVIAGVGYDGKHLFALILEF